MIDLILSRSYTQKVSIIVCLQFVVLLAGIGVTSRLFKILSNSYPKMIGVEFHEVAPALILFVKHHGMLLFLVPFIWLSFFLWDRFQGKGRDFSILISGCVIFLLLVILMFKSVSVTIEYF